MGIVKINHIAIVLFVLNVFLKIFKGIIRICPDNEYTLNLVQRIQVIVLSSLCVILT